MPGPKRGERASTNKMNQSKPYPSKSKQKMDKSGQMAMGGNGRQREMPKKDKGRG